MPDLKPKDKKKCLAMEKKLAKCQFDCGKEPPMSPTEILAKCSHSDTNFYYGDTFQNEHRKVEDCVSECMETESCKAITYRTATKTCYFKSVEGGSSGPSKSNGYISTNMDCDRSEVDLHCQRTDWAFYGADMRSLYTESMEDCVRLCRDTENCKAINYRESDGYCWLKNKRGGSSGPYHAFGHMAMNMECDNTPITNFDCLREGISFYSAQLRNLAVADIQECAMHCQDTENCKAITYQDSRHQCYLKSRSGGYYPQVSEGYSSMNMKCNISEAENMDCLRAGINYPGADKGNLEVSDMEECVRYCRETEGCKSVTFRTSDNRCYLKSQRGGSSGPLIAAGHDSMNMECDNSPVKDLNCTRNGFNYPGGDLRNLVVEEKEDCVKHCRDTEYCKAIVISEKNSTLTCYLKNRKVGLSVPVAAAGYESMNMEQECNTNSTISNMDCLREGMLFNGADIGNTVVVDEKACALMCRDTNGCKSFSFKLSENRCYMKNRRGGSSGPSLDEDYNSMNMDCNNSPVNETMKCLRKGIFFNGGQLKVYIVADIEECIMYCRDTEGCKSLTFREDNHHCYLLNKQGGSSGPTVNSGYKSLNMECDNSKPKQLKCQHSNERFYSGWGSELKSLTVSDVEECLRWCRDTEDCQAVSFRENGNLCELKRRKFEWWKNKSLYTSFNMDCEV